MVLLSIVDRIVDSNGRSLVLVSLQRQGNIVPFEIAISFSFVVIVVINDVLP